MKATGIVRKIDELGRIVLPRELRKSFGIEEKTPLEIYVEDGNIILKKYETAVTIKDKVAELESLIKDNYELNECQELLLKLDELK
jgi:looped-hinge helix DNA binding domain, AbrB family